MTGLKLLDVFFTLLHLLIIGFNLLGWIWKGTRRLHLYSVLITAASWLVLGIWYGIGYCPITDWQWRVKTELGERNLPNSFIKYQVDRLTGINSDSAVIDAATGITFAVVTVLSVYLNLRAWRRHR
mgnify:CR=1 FL=1|jgi:Protein of Unknown function (DUF2784).